MPVLSVGSEPPALRLGTENRVNSVGLGRCRNVRMCRMPTVRHCRQKRQNRAKESIGPIRFRMNAEPREPRGDGIERGLVERRKKRRKPVRMAPPIW